MEDPNEFSRTPRSIKDLLKTPCKPLEGVSHYPGWVIGDFIFKISLGFLEGNIVKYVCRYKKKNGKTDLLKARAYLDKLIELEYPDVRT